MWDTDHHHQKTTMASNSEQETRLCGNCKRDIPSDNFTIHEIHCRRNISVCKICEEPIPNNEMEEHLASEHVQVTCKCKMNMEKCLLEEHERSSCPLRLIKCQFCELELAFNKLGDHEEYCGARTERCDKCGSSVLTKDLTDHPAVCGKVTEAAKPTNLLPIWNDTGYEGAWFDSLAHRNTFRGDMFSQIPKHVPRRFYGNSVLTRPLRTSNEDIERNRSREVQRNRNREPDNERRATDAYEDIPADLLAELLEDDGPPLPSASDPFQPVTSQNNTRFNLERESTIPRRDPDFWRNMYSTDKKSRTNLGRDNISRMSGDSHAEDTQLPCEFCEELFPAEDLISHQSACRRPSEPSNRRSSPSTSPDFTEEFRSASPPVHRSQSVLLPCEFCGALLEEEILFHHQDQCELISHSRNDAPAAPVMDSEAVRRDETDFPAAVLTRQSIRTATETAGDIGISQYMPRRTAGRPPRPTRVGQYRPPRQNNTFSSNLEERRRSNIEENQRLLKNQRYDNPDSKR